MARILLADDSPHAQRMGERILREEGFDVVTVTDGQTALTRLAEMDPDLILADIFLPRKSGYDICRYVKGHPQHRHTRVVLTAGLLEPVDDAEAIRVQSDAVIRKPFEASVVMETIRPLVEAAQQERTQSSPAVLPPAVDLATDPLSRVETTSVVTPPDVDPERIRAAVTLALDAALPNLIREITEKVLIALGH